MSVQEVSRLLPEASSQSEVEEAISRTPVLRSKFELRSGYLTERNGEQGADTVLLEAENRRVARTNLVQASRFAPYLHSSGFELVAVSGSSSYGSASLSRDTDLFCVAPAGKMWVSLTASLIMARAYGFLKKGAPVFCLSCVMDENHARSTFKSHRNPLFARDALEAKVLRGRALYESLMRTASWISVYFPFAYADAIRSGTPSSIGRDSPTSDSVLNRLLRLVVGRYLRAKAYLLNRKLVALGREGDVFHVRMAKDHLIYESRRYAAMRRDYDALST